MTARLADGIKSCNTTETCRFRMEQSIFREKTKIAKDGMDQWMSKQGQPVDIEDDEDKDASADNAKTLETPVQDAHEGDVMAEREVPSGPIDKSEKRYGTPERALATQTRSDIAG